MPFIVTARQRNFSRIIYFDENVEYILMQKPLKLIKLQIIIGLQPVSKSI